MKNRHQPFHDNWATPPYLYDELNKEFNFDFDPCPYNTGDIVVDGLTIDWGERNFVNPPYSQKMKHAFIEKAISESKKGKLCVMLLPVSTSTECFHDIIKPNAKEIRFLRSRVKFAGINSRGQYVNWHDKMPKAPEDAVFVTLSGMHDSMIIIF